MLDIEILHKDINKPRIFKKPAMVMAHFSLPELDMLDHLQGGEKRDSAGVRTYNGVYHGLLKHAPIKETFLEHAREHNANGGAIQAKIRNMKRHGRYGDTEVAKIPQGLAEIFDKAIGGRVHNPYDGHPEYFELGPKLAPLMNMFKNSASSAGNFLRNSGSSLMSGMKRAGSGMSNAFSKMTNRAPQAMAPRVAPPQAAPAQPQSWRNWAESGTRQNLGPALERGMQVTGGVLGGYAGNRAANSVTSALPLPSSLVVAPATAYGAYRGQRTGRDLGRGLTNALASGAGHVGGAADYVSSIPAVQNAASGTVNAWNRHNPVGHAYRNLGGSNFAPRLSAIPEAYPRGFQPGNRTSTGALLEDVD